MEHSENNQFLIPNLCDYQSLLLMTTVMQLLVVLNMLFQFGVYFDWVHFGLVTIYVQGQAMCSAMGLCVLRPYLLRYSTEMAVFLAFIVLMLIALMMALLVHIVWLNNFDVVWHNSHFILRSCLISAIISAIGLRYLYVQQQLLNQQQSELRASLLALQARIRPHFLFNTLNSIASLVSFEPDKAELMIEDLSSLIRASLREEVESSIAEEWALCEAYLHIEKIRLESRLSWTCDFSELDSGLDIPSLSLQPLIENAIYHGIQPNAAPGWIRVVARSDGSKVMIHIENSQSPEVVLAVHSSPQGHQIAVDNIRHRLLRLYGESIKLELKDLGDRFRVTMSYELDD